MFIFNCQNELVAEGEFSEDEILKMAADIYIFYENLVVEDNYVLDKTTGRIVLTIKKSLKEGTVLF